MFIETFEKSVQEQYKEIIMKFKFKQLSISSIQAGTKQRFLKISYKTQN